MARDFVQATPTYVEGSTIPATAQPFTFGAWFKGDDAATRYTIISFVDASATSNYFELRARGDDAQQLQFRANAVGGTNASTSNAFSAGEWYCAIGRANGDADRDVYLLQPATVAADFANGGNDTNSKTPTGLDTIAVGRRATVAGNEMDGKIGESFVYDTNIADWAIVLLGSGYSPLDPALAQYRANLVWYKSLQFDIEYPNYGATWTDTSTTDDPDHPPILLNVPVIGSLGVGGGGGSLNIPVAMHSYRRRRVA